jgi:hypothetical protein
MASPLPTAAEKESLLEFHSRWTKTTNPLIFTITDVVAGYREEANRMGLMALRIIHGRGIDVRRAIAHTVLARTPLLLSYRDAPGRSWPVPVQCIPP